MTGHPHCEDGGDSPEAVLKEEGSCVCGVGRRPHLRLLFLLRAQAPVGGGRDWRAAGVLSSEQAW